MGAVLVKNADRMMTSANPVEEGIEVPFADGCRGRAPFADTPEVKGLPDLVSIELPNPCQLGPWHLARRDCRFPLGLRPPLLRCVLPTARGSRCRGRKAGAWRPDSPTARTRPHDPGGAGRRRRNRAGNPGPHRERGAIAEVRDLGGASRGHRTSGG